MIGFLGTAYLWVKAAHIIFVIFWMAGLFLLPRYLVHHQEALGSPQAGDWTRREELLRRMILTPSLLIVWLLGLILAANLGLFDGGAGLGWLHAKLLLVFLLSG
ncbi:MAG: CopD family protein, partial [Sphingomonadales bacterium]